ncbi:MAG: TIGR00366 family protein, partial [Chthoniobacterales bacterium]
MTRPPTKSTSQPNEPLGLLARTALSFTAWTERWVPDAFVFALIATVIVVVAGFAFTPATVPQVIDAWGKGFWELIPFTLQMALIIITGHVLASSPPVGRIIRAVAAWPATSRNAVALVTFFAMTSAWFNWGFSLIFSAVLAKEIARRIEGVDYRALAAASFLGLGSIWAQGLSGSAALQMATSGALQPQIRDIVAAGGIVPRGLIPFRHTIFLWQSVVSVIVEIVLVTLVMWLVTPPAGRGK